MTDFVTECFRSAWKPTPKGGIGEWARETIRLTATESKAYAGQPYDWQETPHVGVIFDFLQRKGAPGDHPDEWRELYVIKGSQSGVTLAASCAMTYLLTYVDGNILWIGDTKENVRETVKRRFDPIFRCVPGDWQDQLDKKDQTTMTKSINGRLVKITGAGSASGMISWPISRVFIDEAETHEILAEGATIDLGRERIKRDPDGQLVCFTKPQDEPEYERDPTTHRWKLATGKGTLAYDRYLSGTQERYHYPCPHCGKYQTIEFENLRYDHCRISDDGIMPVEYDEARMLRETFLECIHCHKAIHQEKHHRAMASKWRLRPAEPEQRERKDVYPRALSGVRSIRIPDWDIFSTPSVSWGALAVKWVQAQGDDNKLQSFHNGNGARPMPKATATHVVDAHILALKSEYERFRVVNDKGEVTGCPRALPINPWMIAILVDHQTSSFKWMAVAYTATEPEFLDLGEIWVLDWGAVSTEEVLFSLCRTPFISPTGEQIYPWRLFMDCGFRWSESLEMTWKHHHDPCGWRALRGSEARITSQGKVWVKTVRMPTLGGAEVPVGYFEDYYWQRELTHYRIRGWNRDKYAARRVAPVHPRIHFPSDITPDLVSELTNIHLVTKQDPRTGYPKEMWDRVNSHQPIDWNDCLKMAQIAWEIEGCRPDI